ncbi:peptide-methionine (R)-S-oxide reductase [Maritimibacter sp. 55A14]|uniref:peptide-methionine (R)-S-oxide reductase n=1 Tax=Maritimibacter sp. 55A14 TaxID=2174844 RepID=UPI0013049BD6|nr:peptide-methionine (R)-S-oxide reductase [Maritimibacter sp. 55A14]
MTQQAIARRSFLAGGALAALATGRAAAEDAGFRFEVSHSPADWHDLLSPTEYEVLREGRTEWPRSSALWDETRAGVYHCKGCALAVFDSRRKVPVDKGWAFFSAARENTLLTAADEVPAQYGGMGAETGPLIEVHCRRCGSHLGHILLVEDDILHCINGVALTFKPGVA